MAATVVLEGSTIKSIAITRPSWNATAQRSVPTQKGEDRRHVAAWWVLREKIVANLEGKTLSDAVSYLKQFDIEPASASKQQVEWGLWELAKSVYNQADNLWAGPSKPNRWLGSHIKSAEKLLNERGDIQYPHFVKAPDGSPIPLLDENQVIDWLYNMAIDWDNCQDVKMGGESFEEFLTAKGI
ncbi:MAG: hypothetical protein N2C14_09885 [Planctomycetales bacterium]